MKKAGRKSKLEEAGLGLKAIEMYRDGHSFQAILDYVRSLGFTDIKYDNVRNYILAHKDEEVVKVVDGEVVLSDDINKWAGLADGKFQTALNDLNNRAEDIYNMAIETQDLSTALKAVEQLRRNIQTFSRELGEAVKNVVNIERQYNIAMVKNMREMVGNLEEGVFERVDKELPEEYAVKVRRIIYEVIEEGKLI